MLHRAFEDSFTDLLATWHRYRDAHEDGGALVEIAALRHELDERRRRVRSIRRFLSPQEHELEGVALAAFCPSLDSTVFVPYSGISQAGYECACGSFVAKEA
jgi:hypothetical protein